MKKYYYSEIFKSIQGEGKYTGVTTVWLRFWSCNLQCNGFGQEDPTDPSTYDLPYKDFDVINVKTLEELPVWDKGCDSSYTWAKKYRHLCHHETAEEIADKLIELLPNGKFNEPEKGINIHLAFTGGEPMLNQEAMIEILDNLEKKKTKLSNVTIETNGSVPIKESLIQTIAKNVNNFEWFWSISPKLFRVSGEKSKKAIKPKVVATYQQSSPFGQIKPVLNNDPRAWIEFEGVLSSFINESPYKDCFPIYVMPVGATDIAQENIERVICDMAMERGWNFSARLHTKIFGNAIGT